MRRAALRPLLRHGHTLIVPEVHAPYTQFKAGIPVDQVRELSPKEKTAAEKLTWSTSIKNTFNIPPPKTFGWVLVPEGECWIVERGKSPRVISGSGNCYLITGFVVPFLDKIKRVKSTTTVVAGFVKNVDLPGAIKVSNIVGNKSVDAYATIHYKIVNPLKVIIS